VRIAALGGLWQAAILGFAGLGLEDDGLHFVPRLPPSWEVLRFRVQWRGREVEIRLERATRLLAATLHSGDPMRIHIGSHVHTLEHGHAWRTCWDQPALVHALDPAA
jgi:trehalose/maltose hydrolase-like predicted phosphorylase